MPRMDRSMEDVESSGPIHFQAAEYSHFPSRPADRTALSNIPRRIILATICSAILLCSSLMILVQRSVGNDSILINLKHNNNKGSNNKKSSGGGSGHEVQSIVAQYIQEHGDLFDPGEAPPGLTVSSPKPGQYVVSNANKNKGSKPIPLPYGPLSGQPPASVQNQPRPVAQTGAAQRPGAYPAYNSPGAYPQAPGIPPQGAGQPAGLASPLAGAPATTSTSKVALGSRTVPAPSGNVLDPVATALMSRGIEAVGKKSDEEIRGMWDNFKSRHNKKYKDDREEADKLTIFKYNLDQIDRLNAQQTSVVYGITPLSDMNVHQYHKFNNLQFDEFSRNVYEGTEDGSSEEARGRGFVHYSQVKDTNFSGKMVDGTSSKAFDWRDHPSAVSGVRNQGTCGDCWAVAAVEDIEGSWALYNKLDSPVLLAEQQITACDTAMGGCEGGQVSSAYQYVRSQGGIMSQADYPYGATEEAVSQECPSDTLAMAARTTLLHGILSDGSGSFSATIDGWTQFTAKADDELKTQVTGLGPLAVGINADQMQFYQGGIDTATTCRQGGLNHAVLLVGYDVDENNKPYWIIKNSWGPWWGEYGYYRIYMEGGGCGVKEMVMHSLQPKK